MRLSARTREDLEREVFGQEFGRKLKETFRRETAIARFGGPRDLLEFLHTRSDEHGPRDAALCALLRVYQADEKTRPAIGSLLLLILWPALEAIVRAKREKFRDWDDLWGEVHWAFLETAWLYPVERRPSRVANNLKLDTLMRLCAVERERWRQRQAVRSLVDAAKRRREEPCAPAADSEPRDAARETEFENPIKVLDRACRRAVKERRISDFERVLITATRIYGRALKEYAREHGLAYEAAKKRRQRAEEEVRLLLERERYE